MARRGFLLAVAFLLAVFVGWAIYPRTPPAPQRRIIVLATTAPPASPLPPPSPVLQATQSPSPSGVRVAIIIDDCGQWLKTEQEFLTLPIPLTLSVLPHVRYTKEIAQEAAAAGKGVMLHLPMEAISPADPGPGAIDTAMSDAQITAQTQDDIAQVPPAQGLNNHEGSKATADDRVMRDVMAVVKERGLFFIDSRTTAKTVAAKVAQETGVPEASRNVFLDDQADETYTEAMLQRTVSIAQRQGFAIAIGHPKATTLAALQAMYAKMQAEGVQFVLASHLVR